MGEFYTFVSESKVTLSYLLIPLDIFRKNHHNISSKLDAWLMFIASDQPRDIREVFHFRYHKKELVSMFSEALRILDANTTQYMIEVQQAQIEALQEENRRHKEEIERLQELLAQKE